MNTKLSKLIAVTASIFILSGCNEEKIANPDILNVGTYEGCAVKYIDRGTQCRSFYIAKCEAPSTIVTQEIQSGKSSFQTATISVQAQSESVDPKQQKIADLEQQLKQLQSQINTLKN